MKRSLVTLGLLVGLVPLVLCNSGAGCEGCKKRSSAGGHRCCDDRGLLDLLDSAAGKLRTKTMEVASGKCQRKKATQSSCDCDQCGVGIYADKLPRLDLLRSSLDTIPPAVQPMLRAPREVPVNEYGNGWRSIPAPPPPAQTLPRLPTTPPDAEVDPFLDDSVNRVRRVPARTIQHRRSTSDQGAHSTRPAGRSAQVGKASFAYYGKASSGTRTGVTSGGVPASLSISDVEDMNVVTASGQAEVPSRLPPTTTSRARRLPARATAMTYENPLRSRN